MGINLSGQVPGEQLNALLEHEDVLLAEKTPDSMVAIVIFERASRKYDDVKQVTSATVRLKWIEILEGKQAEFAIGLRDAAYGDRTGEATLPVVLDGVDDDEASEEGGATVTDGPWAPDPDFDGPAVA